MGWRSEGEVESFERQDIQVFSVEEEMSPTSRALKILRDAGYLAAVVEKWNCFAKIRQDLFGLIDIIAVKGTETLGIQVTTDAHKTDHMNKALKNKNICSWIEIGFRRFEIWTFGKRGSLTSARKTWKLRRWKIDGSEIYEIGQ